MKDAELNTTKYAYDALSRLTRVTDALDQNTNYQYDATGHLTKITDALSRVTTFRYTDQGRVERETNPLGKNWFYRYDQAGNLTEKVTPRGVIRYLYDKDDLLVRIDHSAGTPDVSFAYDDAHNLVTMTDGLGVTSNEYDLLDRLKSSTNHKSQRVAYDYDAASNLTSFTHEDGAVLEYGYDQNNRQSRVTDPDGNVFEAYYDATHNLTRIDYPNDTEAVLAYDDADRMLSVGNRQTSGDIISQFTYTLDRVGNRTRTEESYRWPSTLDVTTDYTYDKIYRLTRSQDTSGRFSEYDFDAVGNRLKLTSNYDPYRTPTDVPTYTVTSTYNAADQLTRAVSSRFGGTDYTYDNSGNRLRREGPDVWTGANDTLRTDYTFDAEDRVTKIANSRKVGSKWQPKDDDTMEYDGLDRLFRRTHDPKQGGGGKKWSDFVYDGLDPVSEHLHPSPRYTNYHRGLGRMLEQHDHPGPSQGTAYWYHHDGLGSVSAMTKHQGQSVHTYRYGDYGTPLDVNGKAADSSNFTAPHNTFTYTGQEWVPETRNHHFYSREYEPYVGVWTRSDRYRGQAVEPRTLHRYAYVANHPVNYRDRFGFERGGSESLPLRFSIYGDIPSEPFELLTDSNFSSICGSSMPLFSSSKAGSQWDSGSCFKDELDLVEAFGDAVEGFEILVQDSADAVFGRETMEEIRLGMGVWAQENPRVAFALDHPYITGLGVGLVGGAAAVAAPTVLAGAVKVVDGATMLCIGTPLCYWVLANPQEAREIYDFVDTTYQLFDVLTPSSEGPLQCYPSPCPNSLSTLTVQGEDLLLSQTLVKSSPSLNLSLNPTTGLVEQTTPSSRFLTPSSGSFVDFSFSTVAEGSWTWY